MKAVRGEDDELERSPAHGISACLAVFGQDRSALIIRIAAVRWSSQSEHGQPYTRT